MNADELLKRDRAMPIPDQCQLEALWVLMYRYTKNRRYNEDLLVKALSLVKNHESRAHPENLGASVTLATAQNVLDAATRINEAQPTAEELMATLNRVRETLRGHG